MSAGGYIVRKDSRVLELRGPFQYAFWVYGHATVMSFAKAHVCVAAFGGEVVAVTVGPTSAHAMAKPEREAETLPPPPFGWSLTG